MKTQTRSRSGITLLEVLIVMAVLGVIAIFVLWPRMHVNRSKSKRIACVGCLKQIGLSTRQWAMDHGDTYPPGTAMTNGGTLGHPFFSQPWVHFQMMSNELNTPVVLVCPTDRQMKVAPSFGPGFGSKNVSYFFGVDAREDNPPMLLSGDRNITTNGVRLPPGLHILNTNHQFGWDGMMHRSAGNIGLADGSVQQTTGSALHDAATWQGTTNRLAIP